MCIDGIQFQDSEHIGEGDDFHRFHLKDKNIKLQYFQEEIYALNVLVP